MDTADNDAIQDEDITTCHYIRSRKRQKTRLVKHVLDVQGQLQTDQDDITRLFTNILDSKYSRHQADRRSFQKMVSCDMPKIPGDTNTELDQPITMEELRDVVKKGKDTRHPVQMEYATNSFNRCGM